MIKIETKFTLKNPKGKKIVGIINKPDDFTEEKRYPLIILLHGFKGFKEQAYLKYYADFFSKHGFITLRFDSTDGMGESDGNIENCTMTQYIEDFKSISEYAKKQPFTDKENITLYGQSMGSRLLINVPEIINTNKRLITQGVNVDFMNHYLGKYDLDAWKRNGFMTIYSSSKDKDVKVKYKFYEDQKQYEIPNNARKITVPWLILQGSEDKTVPIEDAFTLHETASETNPNVKLQIITGAPHTFKDREHLEKSANAMLDWISIN